MKGRFKWDLKLDYIVKIYPALRKIRPNDLSKVSMKQKCSILKDYMQADLF